MKWKCLKCNFIFDDRKVKKCKCETSPSPWEPIPVVEIQFERVEVNAGTRKLDSKWTIELDPEVVVVYGCPETKWDRFCHWFKYLFVKGKIEKL
jgi:hypothetical protein